jgi:ATP-dependent Clp protease protease subunit
MEVDMVEGKYKNLMDQLIESSTTAYICFLAGITKPSIDKLISTVNEKRQQGFKRIVIMLSSLGGSVSAGVTGYNYLSGLQDIEVVTHNIGCVASAAVSLYCGGHNRWTTPYAFFLIHEVDFSLNGTVVAELSEKRIMKLYKGLEAARHQGAIILSKITKRTVKQVESDMKEAVALNSVYSVTWGLTHKVVDKTMEIGQKIIFIEN